MPVELQGGLTWAILLTAAGAGVAAVLVSSIVEIVRRSIWPTVNGAQLAFVVSAVLYVLATVFNYTGPDSVLVGVVSWVGCALASVGVHQVAILPIAGETPHDMAAPPGQ